MDLNLTHKQKEAAAFNEKIAASKYQVGVLEGAIKNCDNLTQELTAQIAASGAESERGKNRLQELAPAIASLKERLSAVSAELTPLQETYNAKTAEAQKMESDLRSAEEALQRSASSLMGLVQKQMEVSNRISLEESSVARENEDLIVAEKASQTQTAGLEGIQKALEEISARVNQKRDEVAKVREEIALGEENHKNLQQQRASLNEKLSVVKSARAALNAKLEMIQAQGKNDPYWLGVQALTQSGISGIKGTLRKALKYPADMGVAVEEAFGKYLDAILCADDSCVRQALDLLKQKGDARAKFIILSDVPQISAQEGSLKQSLEYAPELENLINFVIGGYDYEEGTVRGRFFVGGGATDIKAPEAYWAEEETVRGEMQTAARQEEEISAQIISNYEQLTKAEENLRALRGKSQEAVLSLNSVQNEQNNKERELKNTQDALAKAAARKQEILLRVDNRRKNMEALKQNLEELKNRHAQEQQAGEEIKARQQTLRQQTEELKSALNTISASLYEVKIKKNNVELDLKSTEYEFNTLSASEGQRSEKIASSNVRLQKLAEEKLATQARLSSERDVLAKLEIDEHKMREELELLKKDYDEKISVLNACKKEVSELTIRENDLQNALSNARRQRTTVVNNLFESWNITPEEAQMNFGDKTVDYERVKMMRKRIENMGAVNMTAPEEYDALTERHTFLKTQISDLETAKKDLKSAINKINQTTRENFKYTFEQVRMHFKNIYQTLFRGGECDLVLTQPENLLETGIEIYAQPPGKKLLNITSMSGGEKTLTAMSLLFAFFTHNPSPFCIMDEADAALDEANVERYVNLIKEFSKTTQFIVVTHNKRTMEAARMLYGITMEESGVSKVMSVNLADRTPEDIQKKHTIESLAEA